MLNRKIYDRGLSFEPKFACSHCDHKTHTKFNLDKPVKEK